MKGIISKLVKPGSKIMNEIVCALLKLWFGLMAGFRFAVGFVRGFVHGFWKKMTDKE